MAVKIVLHSFQIEIFGLYLDLYFLSSVKVIILNINSCYVVVSVYPFYFSMFV